MCTEDKQNKYLTWPLGKYTKTLLGKVACRSRTNLLWNGRIMQINRSFLVSHPQSSCHHVSAPVSPPRLPAPSARSPAGACPPPSVRCHPGQDGEGRGQGWSWDHRLQNTRIFIF